ISLCNTPHNVVCPLRAFVCRSIHICSSNLVRQRRNCANTSAAICAAAPATLQYWRRRSTPPENSVRRLRMLDLGTSFIASVERDPNALAIVDSATRLTYAQWYRQISSVVASLDALGLKPGDHLLTAAQNRWEAATIHWACQFVGIIITPVNWRATADELDFLIENAEARALVYEDVTADAIAHSKAAQTRPRIALGRAKPGETGWSALSE